jgi:hypothetical protein
LDDLKHDIFISPMNGGRYDPIKFLNAYHLVRELEDQEVGGLRSVQEKGQRVLDG